MSIIKGKFVYLMQNKLGLLKIGISKDVDKRRNQLSLTSGVEVRVLYKQYAPDAKVVEDALHRFFRASRKEGEYFQGIGKDFAISKIRSFISLQEETIAMAEYTDHMSTLSPRDAYEFDRISPGCRALGKFSFCDISLTVVYGLFNIVDPFARQNFTSEDFEEVQVEAMKEIHSRIQLLLDAKDRICYVKDFDEYTKQ